MIILPRSWLAEGWWLASPNWVTRQPDWPDPHLLIIWTSLAHVKWSVVSVSTLTAGLVSCVRLEIRQTFLTFTQLCVKFSSCYSVTVMKAARLYIHFSAVYLAIQMSSVGAVSSVHGFGSDTVGVLFPVVVTSSYYHCIRINKRLSPFVSATHKVPSFFLIN